MINLSYHNFICFASGKLKFKKGIKEDMINFVDFINLLVKVSKDKKKKKYFLKGFNDFVR